MVYNYDVNLLDENMGLNAVKEENVMGGTCGTYDSEEKCIEIFGGELEGKRPLRRPWHNGRKILKWS
jgi:hypothetical protein